MLTTILEIFGLIIAFLVLAGLTRRYGSHALTNGWMSLEKADAVFPYWRKRQTSIEGK